MNSQVKRETLLWDHYQVEDRQSFRLAVPRFNYLVKLIKNYQPTGKVLDIGLGDGYFLEQLSLQGYKCFGIDVAEKSLAVNEERFKQKGLHDIVLKYGNINRIPFQENSFDIVTASEVLEHLTTKDLQKGIKEVYRILRPGGKFVITVPADEVLAEYAVVCTNCGEKFHRWGHKQSYSRTRLQELFQLWEIMFLEKKLIPAGGLNIFGFASHSINLIRLRSGQKVKQAQYICIFEKPNK